MPFNHYAKIKRILSAEEPGWVVRLIEEPTTAKTYSGETRMFDHYYRIYRRDGSPIAYCKFQQLSLFARIMNTSVEDVLVS